MNDKLLQQAKNLILNEGWSIRKVCKKYGVTRAWLRAKLEELGDNELNIKLQKDEAVNDAAETLPKDDEALEFDDVVQILPPKVENNDEALRLAITNYCIIHNLNHVQFGKKCGLDHSTISKVINGKVKVTDRTIRFINAGLNLTKDELLKYADKKPVPKVKTQNKPNLYLENERLVKENTKLQNENYTLTKKVAELDQLKKLIIKKDEEIAKLNNDLNSVKCNLKKTMQDRAAFYEELQELKLAKPVNADADLIEKQKKEIERLKKLIDKLIS